jgi:hypothetical protein
MRPLLVRHDDMGEQMLLITILPDGRAVCVLHGGTITIVSVENLIVERPTLEFPVGVGSWSLAEDQA